MAVGYYGVLSDAMDIQLAFQQVPLSSMQRGGIQLNVHTGGHRTSWPVSVRDHRLCRLRAPGAVRLKMVTWRGTDVIRVRSPCFICLNTFG
jgi:hypothetical protein